MTDSLRRPVIALAGALLVAGCAYAPQGGGGGRSDLLTRDQIMDADVTTLYDVIARLRPQWLRVASGPRSFNLSTGIVVYQNQTYLGDLQMLRQMSPDAVEEVQYLNGSKATATLPGLSGRHVVGAIVITTWSGGGG